MKFEVLYNFISPVTGRILSTTDYVLVGNRAGIAIPSPILIDIRLNLIDLRYDLEELKAAFNLARSANFIIRTPNAQLPNAQSLSTLSNGIMLKNNDGIISTSSTITQDQLPGLTFEFTWVGNNLDRPTQEPYVVPLHVSSLLKKTKET